MKILFVYIPKGQPEGWYELIGQTDEGLYTLLNMHEEQCNDEGFPTLAGLYAMHGISVLSVFRYMPTIDMASSFNKQLYKLIVDVPYNIRNMVNVFLVDDYVYLDLVNAIEFEFDEDPTAIIGIDKEYNVYTDKSGNVDSYPLQQISLANQIKLLGEIESGTNYTLHTEKPD